MARGKARGTGSRGKSREPTTYYTDSRSDRRYAAEARKRVRTGARRAWAIRFLALVVVGLLAWAYGPTLWGIVRAGAGAQAEDFKAVGENIREGADRRGGAGLEE